MNDRQRRFVEEYLIDLNATAAAERAGYKHPNQQGPRLLVNVGVSGAIAAKMAERSRVTGVTAERVLRELASVAFSDPRKLYRESGDLVPVKELDDDTAASVAGVEVFEEFEGRGDQRRLAGYTRKLKRWDKVAALNLLGKHLGLFPDRHELTGPKGVPLGRIGFLDDDPGGHRRNGVPPGPEAGVVQS